MFKTVDPKVSLPELELEVLEYWRKESIYEKVKELRKDGKPYVFFEGPPTANAKGGIHHVEARVFKDLFPRYQTMRGRRVDRKAGWDSQGLPVELQVEKKLGLKNKKDIEAYGIEKFNAECKKDVWSFIQDWRMLTERIGFWLDLDDPYITYENSYLESVWNIFKVVSEQKDPQGRPLLYKGYKVVPFCTRCGTALSSHEVAQGYKSVTEPSVYIKLKVKDQKSDLRNKEAEASTFILAWTTTPWTLPGNVALAVGADVDYVYVTSSDKQEKYILAKSRLGLFDDLKIGVGGVIKTVKGKDLVGLEYEPLFPDAVKVNDKAFKVYTADFVTTEDGTGVVHTAVMYGEDDYNLGVSVGLETEHTVGEDGRFLSKLEPYGIAGKYVKSQETEHLIVDHLTTNNKLLGSIDYTHDYPFCWRCDTALLYYARNSWFIRMSEYRDKLIEHNNSVNWEPKHIKNGRMGEWLSNVKDWAVSRERYWGTPLPLWFCKGGHLTAIGSVKDLISHQHGTDFYVMRHGEATSNIERRLTSYPEIIESHLTDLGKQQVENSVDSLRGLGINLIISSDQPRAKETAEIVAKALNVKIEYHEGLREISFGKYNGQSALPYRALFKNVSDKVDVRPEGGESWADLHSRMSLAVEDILKKYEGKKVLIVSHGDPITLIEASASGDWRSHLLNKVNVDCIGNGQWQKVSWPKLPRNSEGELDLHRPFIDEVELNCCVCNKPAKRVLEVADVWFDSGSMPFSQWGYPHKEGSAEMLAEHYPADFISEAIDQTRGWFYTLQAIATILGKESPYKNVICLGHVNDEHGKKMSKSKGNIVDPIAMIDKYGTDAVRYYFYSVNPPGEPKLFIEKDLQSAQRRVMMMLWNIYGFFATYANESGWKPEIENRESTPLRQGYEGQGIENKGNVLDGWIWARLQQLNMTITKSLDKYDVLAAARPIGDFVEDLSTWYLRRSRSRFAEGNGKEDREAAFSTMYLVLVNLSKLMAPFTPFIAENIHKNLTGESVHMQDWPVSEEFDAKVVDDMNKVRKIVSLGLEARMQTGIKVRQKLNSAFAVVPESWGVNWDEYLNIFLDELNVSYFSWTIGAQKNDQMAEGEFVEVVDGEVKVSIDKTITPELELEGMLRELIRGLQDWRKKNGLTVSDRIEFIWDSSDEKVKNLMNNAVHVKTLTQATRSELVQNIAESMVLELDLNGHQIKIEVAKS